MDISFALRTDEFYLNCSSRKTSNLSRSCNISRTKSTRNLPIHLKQALTIVRPTCLLNELNQPTKLSSLAFRLIISGGKINSRIEGRQGSRRQGFQDKALEVQSACLRAMAVSSFCPVLLSTSPSSAHFRSQILATDAFGPLGSCSDVCDEISSTADFDLPSRDRNDLEALDARARQTANIATPHSSGTRKSAWGFDR